MATILDIAVKHHGEQSLAKEVLKIAPLIEKHFKTFTDCRVATTTGKSAKFYKVCKAFYDDVEAISKARVYVEDTTYSVWVKIDINESSGNSGCNYFHDSVYIGDIKENNLKYTFNFSGCEKNRNEILATDITKLEEVWCAVVAKHKEIDVLVKTVPYVFNSLVEDK